MEQKQPDAHYVKDPACFISELCKLESKCRECREKGLGYLLQTHYIPRSMIPLEYMRELWELDLPQSAIPLLKYMAQIEQMVEEGKGFYLYSSRTGTGKTTAACNALKKYLALSVFKNAEDLDNRRVLYINVPMLLEMIRASYNNPNPQLDYLLDELKDLSTAPKLILFDDIGAEKPSDWVRERLYSLLNFRVSNGLANIFTSNLSPAELAVQLGDRVASRCMANNRAMELTTIDHRIGGLPW